MLAAKHVAGTSSSPAAALLVRRLLTVKPSGCGLSPLETGVHGEPLPRPRRTSGWSSRGAASPYGGVRGGAPGVVNGAAGTDVAPGSCDAALAGESTARSTYSVCVTNELR